MFNYENDGHRTKFYMPKAFCNDHILNEGLIKSYPIKNCEKYLNDKIKFPIVNGIELYRNNPYYVPRTANGKSLKPSNDAFVGVYLNKDYLYQYQELIQTCYNLLGWFTGKIKVIITTPKGNHRPILFEMDESDLFQLSSNEIKSLFYFDRGERYIPAKWIDKEKYFKKIEQDCFFWSNYNKKLQKVVDIEFNEFIHNYFDLIESVELIIEQKYPINDEYIYDEDENFYHLTTKDKLQKILKNSLIPKSLYNYPDRIYLGFDPEVLINMMKDRTGFIKGNLALFKINLKNNQKLYSDPRMDYRSVFTYDNISPNEIIEITEI